MLGASEAHAATPWFWSDQYEHQLQVSGEPVLAVSSVTRTLDAGELNFYLGADGRLVGASGFGPVAAVAKDLKLARMLVERRAAVAPALLADPATPLKPLLAAERTSA
jgi:3-phenylpropionate/trans-cinnamate dioxygenase ferredoxin reductase subunit